MVNTPQRSSFILFVLLLTILFYGGCTSTPVDPVDKLKSELDRNRLRWQMYGADSYTFTVLKFCYECHATRMGKVIITVENNEITHIHRLDFDEPVHEQYWLDFDTIDGLFEFIEAHVQNPPGIFEVDYHPRLGYPVYIEIDHKPEPDAEVWIVDAGVRVEVGDVEFLE